MTELPESTYMLWTTYGYSVALGLIALSTIIYAAYYLLAAVIKSRSKKYHFILQNEIRSMIVASIGFAAAIAIVISVLLLHERDFSHLFVFCLKVGLSVAVGVTVGFAARAYLRVYYPFTLDRKLSELRFKRKVHPTNGHLMRLLNEEEEDEHLTEEMIRQEEEMLYDFDVWIDDVTGETVIETYRGTSDKECDRCHFKTLKLVSQEIDTDSKKEIKHYRCSYCGNREVEEVFKG